jgi:hypothetical protein
MTIVLAMSISAITFAQKMGTPTFIKAGDKIIDCKKNAAPTIFDFDKDGLEDLIVGTLMGQFRFYKNIGTEKTPVYKNFTFIQANGENARIPNW